MARLLPVLFAFLSLAQAKTKAILWEPPASSRVHSLTAGPGGSSNIPAAPFRFLKDAKGGTSPKIWVRDARGRTWIVKFGKEVLADTFGARLAWAMGYQAAPVYFVRTGTIRGYGAFRSARFKLVDPRQKYTEGAWQWDKNPFLRTAAGRRQLNGLKVLVLLLSNWDAKDGSGPGGANTAVLTSGATRRYLLEDWGASLGGWGNFFTRDKRDCAEFVEQNDDFVKGVNGRGHIEWGFSGKHRFDLTEDIPVADARWILGYLRQISEAEFISALKASGAGPREARCFAQSLRHRVRNLQRVSKSSNMKRLSAGL